jgi:predicted nucleic acid-binding protein
MIARPFASRYRMTDFARTFVDSNILIYANDTDERAKQKLAIEALDELWRHDTGAVSVQVLQEFYNVVTRKMKSRVSKEQAQKVVLLYSQWCGVTTAHEVQTAFRIESTAKISFWDALIVACAQKSGATRILSEDLQHGQIIAGIEIANPFR